MKQVLLVAILAGFFGMIAQAHFQAFPDEVQWTIYGNLKVLSCGLCKVLESGPREP